MSDKHAKAQGTRRNRITVAEEQQQAGVGDRVAVADLKRIAIVFAPALDTEPTEMMVDWACEAQAEGFTNIAVVFNGPRAHQAGNQLGREIQSPHVSIHCLSGPASIGKCQSFMGHLFLQSKARLLVRVDPDGQFPVSSLNQLLARSTTGADVIWAQRDEPSVAGVTRFLGNTMLRAIGLLRRLPGDPNSGCYALTQRAAAVLSSIPLPVYPEVRMLVAFRNASLRVASCVVPIVPRRRGQSSLRGLFSGTQVFISSVLEMLSQERI